MKISQGKLSASINISSSFTYFFLNPCIRLIWYTIDLQLKLCISCRSPKKSPKVQKGKGKAAKVKKETKKAAKSPKVRKGRTKAVKFTEDTKKAVTPSPKKRVARPRK